MNGRHAVVCLLVAWTCLAPGVATAGVTDATDTELERSVVQIPSGETASIPVSLGDADAATVAIGGPDVNYRLDATVRDGDGDGRVVLQFDTAAAGHDGTTASVADGDDSVTVRTESDRPDESGALDPASYDVALYRGAAASGSPVDVGTLAVTAPERARLRYDGDRLTVESGPGQRIRGETELPAGTELTIRIRSADSSNPFLQTAPAVVAEDGRFGAVFDFSDVPAGTTFEIVVHEDGDDLIESRGEVVACAGDCAGEVTPTPTPEPTPTPTPLPDDELAVREVVSGEQGSVVAIPVAFGDADAATLAIGGERVNYRLNATVRDGDGDGRATVLFNTTAAGHAGRTLSVADAGDELTPVGSETRLDPGLGVLDPAPYPVALYRGTSLDGDPVARGRIVLRANETADGRVDGSGDGPPAEFGFGENIVLGRAGERATVPVVLADADAGTVTIGTESEGFQLNATVRDGTGDGRVVLVFDTTAVGADGALRAADEGDAVSVHADATVARGVANGTLSSGDYGLGLHRGPAVTGQPADIGTLVLQPRATPVATLTGTGSITPRPADSELDLVGIGALAGGGLLAVVGIGLVAGLLRS